MHLQPYSGAESSSYSSSSSYSVGIVLLKPCTFELRMRLLKFATTTQDRSNQNGWDQSRNIKCNDQRRKQLEDQIRFECTHKNSYTHRSHIKQNTCQCTQYIAMLLLQNSTAKRISSVFITFSLCKQTFIFVNNSLRPTFININFALVDHKRKVVFWICLIHAPERICPSNQLAFFVFLTKLELCNFNQDCKVGACSNQAKQLIPCTRVQGIFFGARQTILEVRKPELSFQQQHDIGNRSSATLLPMLGQCWAVSNFEFG